jgi:phosphatidate cytidylyltransferase
MSNLAQRLLLFFVGLPLLILAVIFLPQAHHGFVVLVFILGTTGGAMELSAILRHGGLDVGKGKAAALGFLVPAAFYASTFFPGLMAADLALVLALAAILSFAPFAYASKESLSKALSSSAGYSLLLVYPGLLGGMAVLSLAGFDRGSEAILTYGAMVLGNDSLAWLLGVSLGRKRNLFPVSPNKSLAGFIGGFLGSILGGFLVYFLFPSAFHVQWPFLLLMALLMGAATITGDLFESALKRSVGTKDSGSIIPGRGGFLDSFDSLLFCAPVFFLLSKALGLFQ